MYHILNIIIFKHVADLILKLIKETFLSSGSGIVVPIIQTTTGSVVAPLLGTGMANQTENQTEVPQVQVNQPRRQQRQNNSNSSQVRLLIQGDDQL